MLKLEWLIAYPKGVPEKAQRYDYNFDDLRKINGPEYETFTITETNVMKVGDLFRCKKTDWKEVDFGEIVTITKINGCLQNPSYSWKGDEGGTGGGTIRGSENCFVKVGSPEESRFFDNCELLYTFEDYIVGDTIFHNGIEQYALRDQEFVIMFKMDDVLVLRNKKGRAQVYSFRSMECKKGAWFRKYVTPE